ncbi:membrane associated phosphodiesterase [Streptomyces purpurascens]
MSAPPTPMLDGALRAQPSSPRALLPRTRARGHRPGLALQLVLAVVCAGYAVGSALGWGSDEVALVMGDFGLSAAAATASVSCFLYARNRRTRFRPAWLLFGLSSAMASLGNLVWGWYEVVLGLPVPSPSYADLFFLCFAPPAIVGLLVLAKRPVSKAGWVFGLDAWLIGGSLLTLAWSLALAQAAKSEGPGVAHTALSLAYPLLDIALVSMVLALHFRRSAVNRSAVNTAIGALALTVMCDALFTSPLMHHHYRSGQLLDAGWFAGSLLLAYAPWAAPRTPDTDRHGLDRQSTAGHTRVVHEHVPGQRSGPHHQPPTPGGELGRYPAARPISGSLAALTPYLAAAVCTLGICTTSSMAAASTVWSC